MNKDAIIIVCVVVALTSAGIAFFSVNNKQKLVKSLEEERYSRMVAEESSQKSAAKLVSLSAQLKTNEEKLEAIQDILGRQRGDNDDLKSKFEQLKRDRDELEAKLKSEQMLKASLEEQLKNPVIENVVAQPALGDAMNQ